jgi:DNA-binding LytR/AlgR family response regulator
MAKIKVLIVDDEVLMAEELQCLLSRYNSLEIVGLCHDSEVVLEKINILHPHVVFLDIRMPGISGMEVAGRIGKIENPPAIVFSTAYDSYAISAYQVNALDYILKPYDQQELYRVVNKLQKHYSVENSPAYLHKFTVNVGDRMTILDSNSIQLIYAKDRMVFIQNIAGEKYKAKSTLQEYEARLDPHQFFRCHRNYIVNVDQIEEIASWFNRGYLLILKGKSKTEIPVSRAYVNKLRGYVQF